MSPKKVFYILSADKRMNPGEYDALERIFRDFSEYLYAFQLRIKDKKLLEGEIPRLKSLCRYYKVPLIINDFFDLARKYNAEGIHIGIDDIELEEARKILSRDKIIGVSCYNDIKRAKDASLANYVSFGCFFESKTKPNPVSRVDISVLDKWKKDGSKLPCVCIGGINQVNFVELLERGADVVAFSGYLWESKSPYDRFAALVKVKSRLLSE